MSTSTSTLLRTLVLEGVHHGSLREACLDLLDAIEAAELGYISRLHVDTRDSVGVIDRVARRELDGPEPEQAIIRALSSHLTQWAKGFNPPSVDATPLPPDNRIAIEAAAQEARQAKVRDYLAAKNAPWRDARWKTSTRKIQVRDRQDGDVDVREYLADEFGRRHWSEAQHCPAAYWRAEGYEP